eukprot:26746-Eustigmatos_ZCMA.PRE.1
MHHRSADTHTAQCLHGYTGSYDGHCWSRLAGAMRSWICQRGSARTPAAISRQNRMKYARAIKADHGLIDAQHLRTTKHHPLQILHADDAGRCAHLGDDPADTIDHA